MGLRTWWRSRRVQHAKRPWVRPEFLTVAAVIAVLGGTGWWLSGSTSDPGPPAAVLERRGYVGVSPGDLPAADCQPICLADQLLAQWRTEHPEARILEATPLYHQGRLIGYQLVYEE